MAVVKGKDWDTLLKETTSKKSNGEVKWTPVHSLLLNGIMPRIWRPWEFHVTSLISVNNILAQTLYIYCQNVFIIIGQGYFYGCTIERAVTDVVQTHHPFDPLATSIGQQGIGRGTAMNARFAVSYNRESEPFVFGHIYGEHWMEGKGEEARLLKLSWFWSVDPR